MKKIVNNPDLPGLEDKNIHDSEFEDILEDEESEDEEYTLFYSFTGDHPNDQEKNKRKYNLQRT